MNVIDASFEAGSMYELTTQEIEMVAGGDLASSIVSLFNNLVGAATTTGLTPVTAVYNGVATFLNSTNSDLTTGGLLGGLISGATGGLNGIVSGVETFLSTVALIPTGASGANNLTSEIAFVNFFNSLTAPYLNPINT